MKKINNVEYRVFADHLTKDKAIDEFFKDLDKPITTNVVGYIVDSDGENKRLIGTVEESYVDISTHLIFSLILNDKQRDQQQRDQQQRDNNSGTNNSGTNNSGSVDYFYTAF
jgi:hypothetical protein